MKRTVVLTGAGFLVLVAVLMARQATSPAPQASFHAGVEIVAVDVSVLDKNRLPVRGLTAADFTVLDDGKPRPIVAFTPVEIPSDVTPTAPWMHDVAPDVATNSQPSGRLVAILMDRSIPPGQPSLEAKTIATAAINEMGPADFGMVAMTVGGIRQTFTSDRSRLLSALNGRDPGTDLSDSAAEIDDNLQAELTAENPDVVMLDSQNGACYCGLCTLEAIANLAHAVADVPDRRKTLVFIGHSVVIDASDADCSTRVRDAREAMLRELALSNVTIYAFDPVGLETLNVDASSSSRGTAARGRGPMMATRNLTQQGTLQVLSDQTGGRTVLNTNAPADAVSSMYRENSAYYIIGFSPADAGKDTGLRKIEVKVAGHGLTVRTRRGYYPLTAGESAPTPAPPPGTPGPGRSDVALTHAIGRLIPDAELPLAMAAAPFASGGGRSSVVVVTGVTQAIETTATVPGAPATLSPPERVDVLTAAFNPLGRPALSHHQTIEIRVPPAAHGVHYEAFSRLDLKPGHYQIRTSANVAGKTGSVFADMDVPDYARERLALSGIEISTDAAVEPAAREAVGSLFAFTPTVRREFARGDAVKAFARVYQGTSAAPAPVVVLWRIVDATNRPAVESTSTIESGAFGATRSADSALDLPLARLLAGEYLLSIDVSAGSAHAARDARITVR